MRKLLFILALALPVSAFAVEFQSGTLTANGETAAISCASGVADVSANYASGSGTIDIQYYHDVSGWLDIPENATFTATFKKRVYAVQIRLQLSSASSASIPFVLACR